MKHSKVKQISQNERKIGKTKNSTLISCHLVLFFFHKISLY